MYRITVSPWFHDVFSPKGRPGATALTGAMAGAISTEPRWSSKRRGMRTLARFAKSELLASQCAQLVSIGDAVD